VTKQEQKGSEILVLFKNKVQNLLASLLGNFNPATADARLTYGLKCHRPDCIAVTVLQYVRSGPNSIERNLQVFGKSGNLDFCTGTQIAGTD